MRDKSKIEENTRKQNIEDIRAKSAAIRDYPPTEIDSTDLEDKEVDNPEIPDQEYGTEIMEINTTSSRTKSLIFIRGNTTTWSMNTEWQTTEKPEDADFLILFAADNKHSHIDIIKNSLENKKIIHVRWMLPGTRADKPWETALKNHWIRNITDTCRFMGNPPKTKLSGLIISNFAQMGSLPKRCSRDHVHNNKNHYWQTTMQKWGGKLQTEISTFMRGDRGETDIIEINDIFDKQFYQQKFTGIQANHDTYKICKVTENRPTYFTGLPLNREAVQEARKGEIKFIQDLKVWTQIDREECKRRAIPIIKARWIDINKRDDNAPLYRSRYVAKEYNDGRELENSFAITPPWRRLDISFTSQAVTTSTLL